MYDIFDLISYKWNIAISMCNRYKMLLTRKFASFFPIKSLESGVCDPYNASQFQLTTFQALISHMWLVASLLDRAELRNEETQFINSWDSETTDHNVDTLSLL